MLSRASSDNRARCAIAALVVGVHLALIAWAGYMQVSLPKARARPLQVRSMVTSQPSPPQKTSAPVKAALAQGQEPSLAKKLPALPPPAKATAPAKAKEESLPKAVSPVPPAPPAPPTAPSAAKSQAPSQSKPQTPQTPLPTSPPKAPAKAAPSPQTAKAPPAPSQRQKLLSQAQEKLSQVGKEQARTPAPAAQPMAIAPALILPSEQNDRAPHPEEREENSSSIASQLQQQLTLPEHGIVTITLTLDPQGYVARYAIVSGASTRNKSYLERALPQLVFSLQTEKELSLQLTLTSLH